MKNFFLTLFLVLYSVGICSQQTELDKWDTYTNPGTDNFFYNHFKNDLNEELFSKEKFTKYKTKIVIQFNLSKDYDLLNLRTNAKYPALRSALLKSFAKIPLNKLILNEASELHNYSFQILAHENGKTILKCSSSILHEIPPILEGCEQFKDFKIYRKCLFNKLNNYVESNYDTINYKLSDTKKNIKAYPKFYLGKDGKIEGIIVDSKDSILKQGIKKVLDSFNLRYLPSKQNKKIDRYGIGLTIESKHIFKDNSIVSIDSSSTENELSHFFKKHLSESLINLENLNNNRKTVSVWFSLDNNNKIQELTTTAKNKELNNKIIEAFQQYPHEKFQIKDTNPLNRYSIKVIDFEKGAPIIKCSNKPMIEILPVFKGCKKSITYGELKKCNNKSIANYVKEKFNTSVAKKTNLKGIVKIYAMFKINNEGKVENIKVKSPHKLLTQETIRTLKSFKAQSPGKHSGESANFKFSLPIAFMVGSNLITFSMLKPIKLVRYF